MVRDYFHDQSVRALENDGWTITDDPLRLRFGATFTEIDLGAERLIGARKGLEQIAVEIKSFIHHSHLSEFHTALGQYLNYRVALEQINSNRELILAIPDDAYKSFSCRTSCER